jgi:hypothetical protein
MKADMREGRVQELGESNYLMLKESYGSVQVLKGLVDRLHAACLQQEKGVDFDTLYAVKVTTDRLYTELERYLRPECDPDSAYDDAMTENPMK